MVVCVSVCCVEVGGGGGGGLQNKTLDQYLSLCQTSTQLNKHFEFHRDLKNFNTKL